MVEKVFRTAILTFGPVLGPQIKFRLDSGLYFRVRAQNLCPFTTLQCQLIALNDCGQARTKVAKTFAVHCYSSAKGSSVKLP